MVFRKRSDSDPEFKPSKYLKHTTKAQGKSLESEPEEIDLFEATSSAPSSPASRKRSLDNSEEAQLTPTSIPKTPSRKKARHHSPSPPGSSPALSAPISPFQPISPLANTTFPLLRSPETPQASGSTIKQHSFIIPPSIHSEFPGSSPDPGVHTTPSTKFQFRGRRPKSPRKGLSSPSAYHRERKEILKQRMEDASAQKVKAAEVRRAMQQAAQKAEILHHQLVKLPTQSHLRTHKTDTIFSTTEILYR
ncbi:hypothetical protein VKT23_015995 [Stygiomarasmius scandens]|uniref:Uncharacterized protein n=1 Tax=Marasmiellus scandens TaxID=2682957 RepID=A0ABR1J0J4_9AGAR